LYQKEIFFIILYLIFKGNKNYYINQKKEREKKGKVRLSIPKERIAGLLNKRILK